MTAGDPMRTKDWTALLRIDRTLDPQTRFAGFVIASTANADGSKALLSARQLAATMARSPRSAETYLANLRRDRWITQTERGGKRGNDVRGKASVYSLTQPATQTAVWEQAPTRNGLSANPQPGLRTLSIKERERDVRRSLGLADEAPLPSVEDMEGWWADVVALGRERVEQWLDAYIALTSCTRAATWLTDHGGYDLFHVNDHGRPSGDRKRRRTIWLAACLDLIADSPTDDDPEVGQLDQAIKAAEKKGHNLDAAGCFVWHMVNEENPVARTAAFLTDKEKRTNPAARIVARKTNEWLDAHPAARQTEPFSEQAA